VVRDALFGHPQELHTRSEFNGILGRGELGRGELGRGEQYLPALPPGSARHSPHPQFSQSRLGAR
jgi:hypothetical protein